MQEEVEGAVKGFLKGNQKALINYSVDASIIGGMVSRNNSFSSVTYLNLFSFRLFLLVTSSVT